MSHDGTSSPEPEYLSSGDPTATRERGPRSGRRVALLVGGAVALVGLIGGAVWAWTAFMSTGQQPSGALPADTLGYAAVDLDPSGQQKIEAIRILRKFPAFREAADVDTDDDLRQRILEEAIADSGCDVDYADDIEPWLGQRFAVAAVPGDEQPDPVFVLQVSDAEAADEGLAALRDCEDDDGDGAWEIRDEWAVVAENEEIAQDTADAAADASLADDEDYQRWTEAAGDPGILTAYAAPEAGQVLLDNMGGLGGVPFDAPGGDGGDPFAQSSADDAVPDQAEEALAGFGGAAMTVRFADGALEVEGAAAGTEETGYVSEAGAEVVSTLPEDTVVALGLGLEGGWGEAALDRVREQLGPEAEDGIGFAESQLGLELPDDLETLLGESVAVGFGGDADLETLLGSSDGSDVPIGAKVRGDAEEIEDVLDTLQAAVGPAGEQLLGTDSEEDLVVVGPNEDYRAELLADGGLGDTDAYGDVVREADRAGALLFVNFDAGDLIDELAQEQGDPEVAQNLEPLAALGVSTWVEDEDGHLLLRVTTED